MSGGQLGGSGFSPYTYTGDDAALKHRGGSGLEKAMKAQMVDNVSRDMVSVLAPLLQDSKDIRIAVAFVSRRGLAMIERPLHAALQSGASAEFLVGLDMLFTESEALRALYELCRSTANVAMYCYASLRPAAIYHPKLYLSMVDQDVTCIVGSSNLTQGGLQKNVEVNLVLQADLHDEFVSDVYSTYNRLKFHPKRVVPDDEFLNLYAQMCERQKALQRSSARDTSSRKLMERFSEKAQSLRRPSPTGRDLVGWLELVYDSLPEGEFTNSHVYAHERDFQAVYPENLNVRAKVRQQLQVLRDMGFIQHIGTARWRRI